MNADKKYKFNGLIFFFSEILFFKQTVYPVTYEKYLSNTFDFFYNAHI